MDELTMGLTNKIKNTGLAHLLGQMVKNIQVNGTMATSMAKVYLRIAKVNKGKVCGKTDREYSGLRRLIPVNRPIEHLNSQLEIIQIKL